MHTRRDDVVSGTSHTHPPLQRDNTTRGEAKRKAPIAACAETTELWVGVATPRAQNPVSGYTQATCRTFLPCRTFPFFGNLFPFTAQKTNGVGYLNQNFLVGPFSFPVPRAGYAEQIECIENVYYRNSCIER